MRVTILTVGEYPTVNGLHASQVLPFATYLHKLGVCVNWIAFVPLEMRLRDLLVNSGSLLADMQKLAAQHGIDFTICIFPVSITRAYSYIFRNLLVRLAGSKLNKLLNKSDSSTESHIFHCRSYFATDVALEVKKKHRNILVSFDMRSLLPPEIPLMFPFLGQYLYGGLKRWEAVLLNQAEFSFLPSHRGIRLLEHEGVQYPPKYVPIAGFDDTLGLEQCDNSINNPVVGFVGGFGPWHSASLLQLVFDELGRQIPCCSFEVLGSSSSSFKSSVKVRSLPHQEVHLAVKAMIAVVVPGIELVSDGFMANVSTYFFSTKATEALSLGVPLIVNAKIRELADYVRDKRCGIVFTMEQGQVKFEGLQKNALANKEFWNDLRQAARKCAPEFRQTNVFDMYIKAWSEDLTVKSC